MKQDIFTGIKFILCPTPEQKILLDEHCRKYTQLFNKISQEVFKHYLQPNGKLINHTNGMGLGYATLQLRSILKKDFAKLFEEYEYDSHSLRYCVAFQVANRYAGYYRRNKEKPKNIINMKENRAISYNQNFLRYKDGYLVLTIYGKENNKPRKINIKVFIPNGMKNSLQFLPKNFGGTLDNKNGKYIFIAMVKNPWESQYEPKDWLGYDIGKTTFLYFSDEIDGSDYIKHNSEQEKILLNINDLLHQINRKDIKSSYRSLFRRQWLNAQKKHRRILTPIADKIIQHAIKNKLGLALDGAKFGGKIGSSGQEITDVLKKKAISLGIPFYVTKAAYTSQTCPKCGNVNKKNRKKEEFKCIKCGYENHADKVGAINSKKQAIEKTGFVNT